MKLMAGSESWEKKINSLQKFEGEMMSLRTSICFTSIVPSIMKTRTKFEKFTLILFFQNQKTFRWRNILKYKTKKRKKNIHCKQARLAQHNLNCTDNLKAVLTWFAKEKAQLGKCILIRNVQQGPTQIRKFWPLSCVKCPVIHSLLFNSAGWVGEKKVLSYT